MASRIPQQFRLSRPFMQNLVVASILFCNPGIYGAVTGLGAGGGKPSSLTVANNVNAILYAIFSVVSLGVGWILNTLKPKWCLAIGISGYPIYVGGLWYYDRSGNSWFAYLAGVLLGISSAFLWTAAAYVQFSYPQEHRKSLYISIQWSVRAVGATIGAIIAFCANFHQSKAVGVSTPVYATFVVIMGASILLALLFVIDPSKVTRQDGSHIAVFEKPVLIKDLRGLGKTLIDPRYLLLAIPMFSCEMALGLVSSINSRYFNLRTRALNNLSFQAVQLLVPGILVSILDNTQIKSRRRRGFLGLGIMGTVTVGAAAGLLAWVEIQGLDAISTSPARDWKDPEWGTLFALYTLFGSIYSGYQMVTEWTLSATSKDPEQLSKVAGLFKFYSSLGMFLSFILAAQGVSFRIQCALQLSLYVTGILCISYVLLVHITNTNYFSEASVIVPHTIAQDGIAVEDTGARKENKE